MPKEVKESLVVVKMDKNLKNDVMNILESLGLNHSVVVQMLYKQIALKKGLPFEVSLIDKKSKSKPIQ